MKPENHILKIIEAISDPTRIRNGRERKIISVDNYEEAMTFILHSGTVAIHRSSDSLLLKFVEAPMIVGMNILIDTNEGFYMQAHGDVQYEILSNNSVIDIIERENLWKEAAYFFMFGVQRLLEAHQTSAGRTTYELIKQNLMSLMAEKDELRMMVNACDYIMDKTHISRSRVMKILSDLKTGDYIVIERGVLIKINKLPETY
ncbi:Crp/Fnr family transcriptional regulator [Lelliottia amnigena]|uniref:helix-turn-helix domain-containing protein n=1 Tax=Lelliottia amnigena TaxID=61646 RepID=UPI001F1E2A6A|nr:helix-turn-helix domain-containing protein [Lelliottia amnigena]UJD93796.1 Crp/Fnr family transcriptional regulator [Lelliottia amnigena]